MFLAGIHTKINLKITYLLFKMNAKEREKECRIENYEFRILNPRYNALENPQWWTD
jgi:hypothetical protein